MALAAVGRSWSMWMDETMFQVYDIISYHTYPSTITLRFQETVPSGNVLHIVWYDF